MTTPGPDPATQGSSRWARGRTILIMAALVLGAAVAGALSGFVHRTTIDVAGLTIPIGMIAAIGGLAGLVLLARQVGRSRAAVLVVGAAYAIPLLVLSQFRPEGDLVIAEDAWGLSLLGGAALVITLGVAVPFRPYDGATTSRRDPVTPTPATPSP